MQAPWVGRKRHGLLGLLFLAWSTSDLLSRSCAVFPLALQLAGVSVLISKRFTQYFASCSGLRGLASNLGHWAIMLDVMGVWGGDMWKTLTNMVF